MRAQSFKDVLAAFGPDRFKPRPRPRPAPVYEV